MASTPNTLTGLIPILYSALDTVVRELVGFIPASTRNMGAERAAKDQTITYPIVPAIATADIVANVTAPDDGNATIGTASLTISKSKYAAIRWNGEEMRGIGLGGVGDDIRRDQFTQAMRALVNEVETDLAVTAMAGACRAYGTAGQAPFGTASDFSDAAQALKILDDNGTPSGDRHLVLGTAAIANIRAKQSVLFKVNEAGTESLLRRGIIGDVMGFGLHTSAAVQKQAIGTSNGAWQVNNGAGLPIGTTVIPVEAGAGTIVAGDVITFAADSVNKYVVTKTLAAGSLEIGSPGLRVALPDNNVITTVALHTSNIFLQRSALHLVCRTPAMPDGGDMADDVLDITDAVSGLTFQVAIYRQYRQVRFEVGLAWGTKAVKGDFIGVLLG